MTWRELWKSTVTNLRVLLGITPTPPDESTPPKSISLKSTSSAIIKHKPMPLAGSKAGEKPGSSAEVVRHRDRPGAIERTSPHAADSHASQIIDLTATRALPPPSAPLRTHKPPKVPMDVALNAATLGRHPKAAELPAVVSQMLAKAEQPQPAPELTWSRQGLAQLEPPMLDVAQDDPGFGPPNDPPNGDDGDDLPEDDEGSGGDGGGYANGEDEEEGVALTTLLESLLFVAAEPVAPRQLAQTLGQTIAVIEVGLAELADYYQRSLRGLRVQRFNDKVQLVTAPIAAPFIETFLNLDNTTRLSSPALETLAVIAYRQPVTRAQIEAVRGVDCAGVLRSLVQRGLVADIGRMEGVGRPILYGVTELFMQHFGLVEMGELPPLEETEADRLWAATAIDEDGLDPEPDN